MKNGGIIYSNPRVNDGFDVGVEWRGQHGK